MNKNIGLKAFVSVLDDEGEGGQGSGSLVQDPFTSVPQHHVTLKCTLPSVKGSRAFIEVQLATAILRNRDAYLEYVGRLKEQSNEDCNRLIEAVFEGLCNTVVDHALKARSFRDVTFISPLVFFLNKLAGRQDVHKLITSAGEFVDSWKNIKLEDMPTCTDMNKANRTTAARTRRAKRGRNGAPNAKAPTPKASSIPALDDFAKQVLVAFPSWKAQYMKWYGQKEGDFQDAYNIITTPLDGKEDGTTATLWMEQLKESISHIKATLERNIDKDCEDISELLHACVNTDLVESLFGTIDDAFKRGSGDAFARIAVGLACKAAVFRSESERLRLAKKTARKARHGVTGAATETKCQGTCFSDLAPEERAQLIAVARKRIGATRGERKKAKKRQREDQYERDEAKLGQQWRANMRKILQKASLEAQVKCLRSPQAVDTALKKIVKGNNKGLTFLRNQLRYRKAVFGQIYDGNLFGNSGDANMERSRLTDMVKELINEEANPQPLGNDVYYAAHMETKPSDTPRTREIIEAYRFRIDKLIREYTFELKGAHFATKKKTTATASEVDADGDVATSPWWRNPTPSTWQC